MERRERERERVGNGCPLTAAQLRVLQVAHDRHTIVAKEIARHIGCSFETARVHFRESHKRLGVQERMHAVDVCLENGWIRDEMGFAH